MADRARKKNEKRSPAGGGVIPSLKHNLLYSYQDLFIKYLSAERRLAPNTYNKSYRYDLNKFADFLQKRAVKDIKRVDRSTVRDYISWCRKRHLSSRSISRGISALKGFFRFLLAEKLIDSDPTSMVEHPK
ncbi:MAG: site-specific integrase, partial [Deltaproteobacteria bacterium]|nr:site-specific integrase [Deltaproteobacteria bacterium]